MTPSRGRRCSCQGTATASSILNDEAVYVPTGLNIYDVIELGESKFLYIPFCGEHFKWE